MPIPTYIPRDTLRTEFSTALSNMYRSEVPLYGDLVELVEEVNKGVLTSEGDHAGEWRSADRLNVERHGAIRLGTPFELHTISRLFAILGMFPVGYYDLSPSGVPVHATAFRPLTHSALSINPFRVFTSLLRPELIADARLRAEVASILAKRNIFHPLLPSLIAKAEAQGGLERADATRLVTFALETFKWHEHSLVSHKTYARMKACHALLADIAGFRGPHINHLTPRVLDIDAAQRGMEARGIPPKQIIEGPPHRNCPILLRQTSFKALTEPIVFAEHDVSGASAASLLSGSPDQIRGVGFAVGSASSIGSGISTGSGERGSHRARFGEIEQRGAALTEKGHALYLSLMSRIRTLPTDSNAAHQLALERVFPAFPDDWETIRTDRLAYFRYSLARPPLSGSVPSTPSGPLRTTTLDALLRSGEVRYEPIVYEDFLPASAAGIFQSNLDAEGEAVASVLSSEQVGGAREGRRAFEAALRGVAGEEGDGDEDAQGEGKRSGVRDYWELYAEIERESLKDVEAALGLRIEWPFED